MTPAEFIAKYPEFRNGGTIIQPHIDDSTNAIDAGIFGNRTEEAIGLLAAHRCACSPFAVTLKLVTIKDDGTLYTKYYGEFLRVRTQVLIPKMFAT